MVAPTVPKPASTEGVTMNMLCNQHMIRNDLTPRQFFRASYQRQFQKDISDLALANDVKTFDEQGIVPSYVVAMLLATYRAH